jgi:integrase
MRYGMHLLDGTRHDAPPVVAFLAASSRHAVLGKSSPLLPHKNRVVQPHPLNVGSSADVREFLTFLAVQRKVSASTQNQAFNALLFFYRHVLNKEFGKVEGVVRAKRKPYVPVVLSRQEMETILRHLPPPYDLVVKLLYGCGLRVSECLQLRVHCFNLSVTKICGGRVDHAANSNAWPSACAGTGAEVS